MLHATLNDFGPVLAIILFGFLPNEVWRLVGLMLVSCTLLMKINTRKKYAKQGLLYLWITIHVTTKSMLIGALLMQSLSLCVISQPLAPIQSP